jgi:exoribonuclease II
LSADDDWNYHSWASPDVGYRSESLMSRLQDRYRLYLQGKVLIGKIGHLAEDPNFFLILVQSLVLVRLHNISSWLTEERNWRARFKSAGPDTV